METQLTVHVDSAGRVLIPAAIRQELKVKAGSEMVLSFDGATVHLTTKASEWQAVRQLIGAAIPKRVKLTAELRRQRRRESRS